ncbi:adenylate kinase [Marivirga lumbricoides]|uniref:Adenylate kinase n=1 Tax=Marivirga lumbricoides TaxID=1046115 RepID=A0ABQ1LMX2_9BACT|nr:adenylate kinase [Marivirga lumbricoides]
MKINILGASGSGVTTLGTELSLKLGIDYFDSDDFFWKKTEIPFSIKTDPKTRDSNILEQLSQTESWILGGSVINWSKEIYSLFDLIVFLHIPQKIRMERLKTREFERYDKKIKTDTFWKSKFENFMVWAKDYDEVKGIANRNIKNHKSWLETQNTDKMNLIGEMPLGDKIEKIINRIKTTHTQHFVL